MRNKNAFIKFFTISKEDTMLRNFILKDKLGYKAIKIFYNGLRIRRVCECRFLTPGWGCQREEEFVAFTAFK